MANSHHVIDIDDIEAAASLACCRICLERDTEHVDDELISPCMCKGTQQHVHRSCLNHWRLVGKGFAFSHCTTCKAQFHFRDSTTCCFNKIKFRILVARDVFLVFLVLQSFISILGGIAYLYADFKDHGTLRNIKTFNNLNSRHPLIFYYCVGLLGFFEMLGFFGLILQFTTYVGPRNRCVCWAALIGLQVILFFFPIICIVYVIIGIMCGFIAASVVIDSIWETHYDDILYPGENMRELMQEYVVMDLRGSYVPPELAPEHEDRLRMMDLL